MSCQMMPNFTWTRCRKTPSDQRSNPTKQTGCACDVVIFLRCWDWCLRSFHQFGKKSIRVSIQHIVTYYKQIVVHKPLHKFRSFHSQQSHAISWYDRISSFCSTACAICVSFLRIQSFHWLILMATIISICVHQFHNLCSLCTLLPA